MKYQTDEERYMTMAIREARKAAKNGDVPIGCVIVYDGRNPNSKADANASTYGIAPGTIIGRGYNRRNRDGSSLCHAEILAIKKACRALHDWRVEDCTLYVTLEPCPMCAGAIVQARIPRVVMGAMNSKAGCGGSVLNLLEMKEFNHRCTVTRGVLVDQCQALLNDFFRSLRIKNGKEIS
ncbi:MAG: nucleoside deaminase [Lachnospiraceae bacterium]|nr:nucleoside deaminase [Lachnospiraceae bacterium]